MLERLENLSALYANPHRFMNLAARLHVPLWLAAVGALAFGLFMVSGVPDDYQQGAMVRIMFVHVPAAWMALFAYSFLFLPALWRWYCAIHWVIWQPARPHRWARFSRLSPWLQARFGVNPCGAHGGCGMHASLLFWCCCSFISDISPYGKRLMIMVARRATSILAVVGFVNVPIVKFSVDWWNTLHQPASVSRFARPALHADFLYPLLVMGVAFMLLFLAITLTRLQMEVLRQRLRVRQSEG